MDIKNYVKRNVLNFKSQVLDKAYATKDDLANIDGKSAYEQAVEGGYTGTEAEFEQALANIGNISENTGETLNIKSKYMMGENIVAGTKMAYYDEAKKSLYYHGRNHKDGTVSKLTEISFVGVPHLVQSSDAGISSIPFADGTPHVRGIKKFGDYLFVAVRSNKPNIPTTEDGVWGALMCIRQNDLSTVWTKTITGKCTGVDIYEAKNGKIYLALPCQMSFIQFYLINPNDYTDVTLVDTQYHNRYKDVEGWGNNYNKDVQETQQGHFYEKADGQVLYISCGFGDGVHIWDVTDMSSSVRPTLYNWNGFAHADIWKVDNMLAQHTFDCVINYPYVYCTIAPSTTIINYDNTNGTTLRRAGILTIDISNLSNIQATMQLVPIDKRPTFENEGDPRPTSIAQVGNKLFINNGNIGVTMFDVTDPSTPVYADSFKYDFYNIGYLIATSDKELILVDDPGNQSSADGGNDKYRAKKFIELYKIDTNAWISDIDFSDIEGV